MLSSLRLQASSNPGVVVHSSKNSYASTNIIIIQPQQFRLVCRKPLTLPPFCSLTPKTQDAPSLFSSTVGSSSLNLSRWNLSQRHLTLLNVFACATMICATWLFCSAIPTLLAFKRAAESLEKLMDTAREELPDTMAAIRLSGMEISDLTTELSDLGQEITQGVKSSTRTVRLAEQRLRRLASMSPPPPPPSSSASFQAMAMTNPTVESDPAVAKAARGMREGIVKGRAMLQMFFTLTRFSRFAFNYITGRR